MRRDGVKRLSRLSLAALCAFAAPLPARATCGSANCFLVTGTATSSTSFHAFVQLPIHQDVNDAQLAPRPALLVGLSRVM